MYGLFSLDRFQNAHFTESRHGNVGRALSMSGPVRCHRPSSWFLKFMTIKNKFPLILAMLYDRGTGGKG